MNTNKMAKGRGGKRTYYPKKGRKGLRRRGFRKARDVGDYASASVKRSLAVAGNFVANQMYEARNTDLASYDRAVTIARGYQHFRIKKITLTLKPYYDTYQSAPGAVGRPQAYFMVDKSGALANPTLEDLKQMGAKPRRFDEKPITFSWRPAVLIGDQVVPGAAVPAQYRISPWLSTSANPMGAAWAPSVIDHLGIFFYVEQPAGNQQYFAEMEVQFQFKKPFNTGSTAGVRPQTLSVTVATIDNSPDGVEGGTDGITVPIVQT